MVSKERCNQSGQVLVQVALLLVVLLGFLALAVDVGNLYAQRRFMQNAADAGALAGAREICFGNPGQARAQAEYYATEVNRAQDADPRVQGYTVAVTATTVVNTFVARVIGIDNVPVSAYAEAMCGAANRGCGFLPIAFQQSVYEDLRDGICRPDGDNPEFWVFDGDNEIVCIEDDPDNGGYPCDLDGDGRKDIISGPHRAWMDFSTVLDDPIGDPCEDNNNSCGVPELDCRVGSDYAPMITLPACISGTPGSRDSMFTSANAALPQRIGDQVRFPLYDSYCDGGANGGSCNQGIYRVTSFGCGTITFVEHQYQPPGWPASEKVNVIKVRMDCGNCATSCGGTTPGAIPVPGGLNAVSLIQ